MSEADAVKSPAPPELEADWKRARGAAERVIHFVIGDGHWVARRIRSRKVGDFDGLARDAVLAYAHASTGMDSPQTDFVTITEMMVKRWSNS